MLERARDDGPDGRRAAAPGATAAYPEADEASELDAVV